METRVERERAKIQLNGCVLSEPIWAASCTFSAFQYIHTRFIYIYNLYVLMYHVRMNSKLCVGIYMRAEALSGVEEGKKNHIRIHHTLIFFMCSAFGPLTISTLITFLLFSFLLLRVDSTATQQKETNWKLYAHSFSAICFLFFLFIIRFLYSLLRPSFRRGSFYSHMAFPFIFFISSSIFSFFFSNWTDTSSFFICVWLGFILLQNNTNYTFYAIKNRTKEKYFI